MIWLASLVCLVLPSLLAPGLPALWSGYLLLTLSLLALHRYSQRVRRLNPWAPYLARLVVVIPTLAWGNDLPWPVLLTLVTCLLVTRQPRELLKLEALLMPAYLAWTGWGAAGRVALALFSALQLRGLLARLEGPPQGHSAPCEDRPRLRTLGRVGAGTLVLGAPLLALAQTLNLVSLAPWEYVLLLFALGLLGSPWQRRQFFHAVPPGTPLEAAVVLGLLEPATRSSIEAKLPMRERQALRAIWVPTLTVEARESAARAFLGSGLTPPGLIWPADPDLETVAQSSLRELAVWLMSMPPELSAAYFQHMSAEAVQRITLEISRLPQVTPQYRDECCQRMRERLEVRALTLEETAREFSGWFVDRLRTRLALPAVQSRRRWPRLAGSRGLLHVAGAACVVLLGMALGWLKEAGEHPLSRVLRPFRGVVAGHPGHYVVVIPQEVQAEEIRALIPGEVEIFHSSAPPASPLWPWALAALGVGMAHFSRMKLPAPTRPVAPPAEEPRPLKPAQLPRSEVDPLSFEVGRGLLGLVDPNQGARLLERVGSLRRHVLRELGLQLAGVRFRDNLELNPNEYRILLRNAEIARGVVQVNQFLVIGPEEKLKNLRGHTTTDPIFGMPGIWISPEQRGDAERLGLTIFDPVSVCATHLTEVVRNCAADLLGMQEVANLLDTLAKTEPAPVGAARAALPLVDLLAVLRHLLREQVSILDLSRILTVLADKSRACQDPLLLAELVRRELAAQTADRLAILLPRTFRLPDELEGRLVGAYRPGLADPGWVVDELDWQRLQRYVARQLEECRQEGRPPALVVRRFEARVAAAALLRRTDRELLVLTEEELPVKLR